MKHAGETLSGKGRSSMDTYAAILMIPIAAVLLGVLGWGLVEAAYELFRHRDFDGVYYWDAGRKYDLSSWFEPLPGDKFYGHG